jgi:hypothetical protein
MTITFQQRAYDIDNYKTPDRNDYSDLTYKSVRVCPVIPSLPVLRGEAVGFQRIFSGFSAPHHQLLSPRIWGEESIGD